MYGSQLRRQVRAEKKKTRVVIFTFLLLLILYLITSMVFGENGLLKYLKLKQKKAEMLSYIKTLQQENTKLKEEVSQLRSDPFYIEKRAREELNLSRPDEYIFFFDDGSGRP